MIVMVDFDFVANILFQAHPVEKKLDECLNVVLAEKLKFLQIVCIVTLRSVVDYKIVDVVYDVSDWFLF